MMKFLKIKLKYQLGNLRNKITVNEVADTSISFENFFLKDIIHFPNPLNAEVN